MLYDVSVSLKSKVNQLYTYRHPLLLKSPSRLGHQRALSRVACAVQRFSSVIYFIYRNESF